MRRHQATIAAEGPIVKDRFKQHKQHPAVLNLRDARNALVKCLRALNLDMTEVPK
jgi:hypothetical protein